MRNRLAVALSLAGLVGLAGCAGDPQPRFADPTSPPSDSFAQTSATALPSAGVSSADVQPGVESPEDFVVRLQAASGRMLRTGKTAPYLKLTQNCDWCSSSASFTDGVYRLGRRVVGKKAYLDDIEVTKRRVDVVVLEATVITPEPSRIVEQDGTVVASFPADRFVAEFTLKRKGTSWVAIAERKLT